MCNTCFNRFFKVKEFIFDTFKLKMMFIFKMMAMYIQINIDRWCYVYDDF